MVFIFLFLSLHQYMQSWRPIFERSWCYYSMDIMRTDDSVMLTIPHAGRYSEGPFRCVSDAENVTEPDNSSLPLAFKVNCELIWLGAVRKLLLESLWNNVSVTLYFPSCQTEKVSLFLCCRRSREEKRFLQKHDNELAKFKWLVKKIRSFWVSLSIKKMRGISESADITGNRHDEQKKTSLGEKTGDRISESLQFPSCFQPAGGKDNLSDTVDTAFLTVRDRKTH